MVSFFFYQNYIHGGSVHGSAHFRTLQKKALQRQSWMPRRLESRRNVVDQGCGTTTPMTPQISFFFFFGLKRMNQSVSKLAYILFVGYQNYGVMEGVCFARFHQRGFFATLRARCKTSHVVGKPCVVWVTQDQNNTELHMWLWISMNLWINKSIISL